VIALATTEVLASGDEALGARTLLSGSPVSRRPYEPLDGAGRPW